MYTSVYIHITLIDTKNSIIQTCIKYKAIKISQQWQ